VSAVASRIGAELSEAASYKAAGVDTSAEKAGLNSVFESLRATWPQRGHVKLNFGHFANVVELGPVSVAMSIDGIGTKSIIAQLMGRFDSVGIDCVAMNVNDVVCVGAEPQSMVDYLAVQRVDEMMMAEVGQGLREGANQARISIVGGETAQLPEVIQGEAEDVGFDLVGTCVGTVDPDRIITGARAKHGDVVLGLKSSGVHCNGLTLARQVFGITHEKTREEKRAILAQGFNELGTALGDELLRPTRIYVAEVMDLIKSGIDIRGMAHITTDGFLNLPRLEADVGYVLDQLPEPQPIFRLIQEQGAIPDEEMYEVFNMGVGFCVVVPPQEEDRALELLGQHESEAQRIGYVVDDASRSVTLVGPGLRGRRGEGFEKI
jgi:phosphoribosylformylglycinamidine cyclo-ligase